MMRRLRLHQLRPRSRRSAGTLGALLLLLLWVAFGGESRAAVDTWQRRDILDAILWVESRGRDDVPDGDDGLAIGPYQIHRVYWLDATEFDPAIGGSYRDCRRRTYAERVIDAYMRRYAPDAWRIGDAQTIARIHNGGPKGHTRQSTLDYWRRVRSRLPQ
ncbi:MAG TPA: hypothetical protein ENI87_14410 [bacterium]|nr:hypothetical protein [bacterium]